METYVDVYISSDGKGISDIHKILLDMGLKPTLGDHDFMYNWNGIVTIEEEIVFIEKIQSEFHHFPICRCNREVNQRRAGHGT